MKRKSIKAIVESYSPMRHPKPWLNLFGSSNRIISSHFDCYGNIVKCVNKELDIGRTQIDILTYNSDQKIISHKIYAEDYLDFHTVYVYNIEEESHEEWCNGRMTLKQKTKRNILETYYYSDGYITSKAYCVTNNRKREVMTYDYEENTTEKSTAILNEVGLEIRNENYDSDNKIICTTIKEYDEHYNVIKEIEYNASNIIEHCLVYEYVYDVNGEILKSNEYLVEKENRILLTTTVNTITYD